MTVGRSGAIVRRMAEDTPTTFKKLSQEEKDKIDTWITTHWSKRNCPLCTHIDWHTANYLVATLTIVEGKIPAVGESPGHYGFALVFCGFCGFSVLLHANILGLSPYGKTPNK